jgi:hypothetical protein
LLEAVIAQDPVRLLEQAAERRRERDLEELSQLLAAFPKECLPRVLERLKVRVSAFDGIHELRICLGNGTWKAQPIPFEVAEVYLDEPKATPWLRCIQCQLLLPKRSGFWHNTQTGGWWQSYLYFFEACPGCGGEIVNRGTGAPLYRSPDFPLRPVPPWEFLDDSPPPRVSHHANQN